MKSMVLKTLYSLTMLAGLTACTSATPALQGRINPDLGHALSVNQSAQAIVPPPHQKANTFIPPDPYVMGKAKERYKNGEVKEPVAVNP